MLSLLLRHALMRPWMGIQASFTQSETRNSDPSYQRCTINAIPNTNSLLTKSKIPLALIVTPYRSLKPGDVSVESSRSWPSSFADTQRGRC